MTRNTSSSRFSPVRFQRYEQKVCRIYPLVFTKTLLFGSFLGALRYDHAFVAQHLDAFERNIGMPVDVSDLAVVVALSSDDPNARPGSSCVHTRPPFPSPLPPIKNSARSECRGQHASCPCQRRCGIAAGVEPVDIPAMCLSYLQSSYANKPGLAAGR